MAQPRDTDPELRSLRRSLDGLAFTRLLDGLSEADSIEYDLLARREHHLLESRR